MNALQLVVLAVAKGYEVVKGATAVSKLTKEWAQHYPKDSVNPFEQVAEIPSDKPVAVVWRNTSGKPVVGVAADLSIKLDGYKGGYIEYTVSHKKGGGRSAVKQLMSDFKWDFVQAVGATLAGKSMLTELGFKTIPKAGGQVEALWLRKGVKPGSETRKWVDARLLAQFGFKDEAKPPSELEWKKWKKGTLRVETDVGSFIFRDKYAFLVPLGGMFAVAKSKTKLKFEDAKKWADEVWEKRRKRKTQ